MEESRSSRSWIYIEVCVVVLYFFIPFNVTEPAPKLSQVRGGTPMHKVILTQRGYIQFLRWELAVPEIEEFTFCLWMISSNLTLPHSIFSYSKDERDRLVRSWISAQGRSIHLEIGGNEVFQTRTKIVENRWYHVCESWENLDGRYALWINGRIESQGCDGKTKGHIIPSGGDIVLGQEYTDFDKGLEEGIEGAVLGFNFLLASAFPPLDWNYGNDLNTRISDSTMYNNKGTSLQVLLQKNARMRSTVPRFPEVILEKYRFGNEGSKKRSIPAGLIFGEVTANNSAVKERQQSGGNKGIISYENRRIDFEIEKPKKRDLQALKTEQDPLGLQLIKLSYVRCEIGRGSPFIGGTSMLISWTRTPVRIFGGAIVKNVRSDCGHFS